MSNGPILSEMILLSVRPVRGAITSAFCLFWGFVCLLKKRQEQLCKSSDIFLGARFEGMSHIA